MSKKRTGKIVNLTVHRNDLEKRRQRDRQAYLMAQAKKAANYAGGLAGFAIVAWNKEGEAEAWYDVGDQQPWSFPDFVRRVIENEQNHMSQVDADTPPSGT